MCVHAFVCVCVYACACVCVCVCAVHVCYRITTGFPDGSIGIHSQCNHEPLALGKGTRPTWIFMRADLLSVSFLAVPSHVTMPERCPLPQALSDIKLDARKLGSEIGRTIQSW